MHECPTCGQACDCDGDDLWRSAPMDCECACDDYYEDEYLDNDDQGRHGDDGSQWHPVPLWVDLAALVVSLWSWAGIAAAVCGLLSR